MVVTDSGPLIALARLDLLPLLRRRFDTVLVPETVFLECTRRGDRPGALAIASASDAGLLHRTHVTGTDRFAAENLLDAGESAALVLARRRAVPVLVDERKARRVAARLGIPVVGTVGVLVAARKASEVGPLRPIFELLGEFGYRLSDELVQEALGRVEEA